jgi:hypothetical protein
MRRPTTSPPSTARMGPQHCFLVALLLLVVGCSAYVHDPRGSKRGGAAAAANQHEWSAAWHDTRKQQVNKMLLRLHGVSKEFEDMLQWYTYHPEQMQRELPALISSQPMIAALGLLSGEDVEDHYLSTRNETDDTEPVAPAAGMCNATGASSMTPAALPRCSGAVPSFEVGINSTLPFREYIIVLASAPSHFDYRQTMRDTFLSGAALGNRDARRLFAVGQVRDSQLEKQLLAEQEAHGDLLRTPSFDGYRNLSLVSDQRCHASYCTWDLNEHHLSLRSWILRQKVFEAYSIVLRQNRFRWMVRVDDNNIVRMDRVLDELAGLKRKHELRVGSSSQHVVSAHTRLSEQHSLFQGSAVLLSSDCGAHASCTHAGGCWRSPAHPTQGPELCCVVCMGQVWGNVHKDAIVHKDRRYR